MAIRFEQEPKPIHYTDDMKSKSPLFAEELDDGVRFAMAVRDKGAIVLRAALDEDGIMQFKGLSIFTDFEINHG